MTFHELIDLGIAENHIFIYFTPFEIFQYSRVNHAWRKLCLEEVLWKRLCQRYWLSKKYLPSVLEMNYKKRPFSKIRLTQESINSMKKKDFYLVMKSRALYTPIELSRDYEKEYLKRIFIETSPSHVEGCSNRINGLWRASFFFSFIDSKRTLINLEELLSLQWYVYSKIQLKTIQSISFLRGGKIKLNDPSNQPKTYFTWCFRTFQTRMVQIDSHRPFKSFRVRINAGWILENHNTVLYTDSFSLKYWKNRYQYLYG